MTLLAMIVFVTVTNTRCFFALILGPGPALELVVESNHEQGVLQFDKEVPWIFDLVIFSFGQVDAMVLVCMRQIDLFFELFLGIFYREVLDAKIRSEVFAPFDFFNIAWIDLSLCLHKGS